MRKKTTDHELTRIMIGNQLAIMRALGSVEAVGGPFRASLKGRANDVQGWWRSEYGEEVGFDASLGDRPR